MPTCDCPPSTINGIFPPSCLRDVLRVRRRNLVRQIRARRGQRKTALANHRLDERMARPAHADRCAARRHDVREFLSPAATPASAGRARMPLPVFPPVAGHSATQRFAISMLGHVDDDGIVRRPAFDFENSGDGFCIQRIGGQAINRFRRQRHHFAGAQQFRRARDGGFEKAPACAWEGSRFSSRLELRARPYS